MARLLLAPTYAAVLLALIITVKSETTGQHEFHASLDEDLKYLLDWTFDNNKKTMTFTVRVKTTGWIGFGISPYTGKMPGSDIVIMWVDNNGKVYLQDRFAESRSLPVLDSSQDYYIISGYERNGTTTIKFWRKFNTGDPKDLLLDTGTTRLIWAYNAQDPPSTTNIQIHDKMGARSLNLFERMPENDKPSMPSDVQTHECRVPNATIPARKTAYWCVGSKLPDLTSKHHIIKIEPIITKGNQGRVHHMIMYECPASPDWHDYSADCDTENMPIALRYCRSGALVAGWAVGGEGITFPKDTGFSLGGKDDPKFTVIEMHYDNPEEKAGIVDNSGFRIYYTKQIRKYDIGVLTLGHLITATMAIPEKQSSWNITGYCPQFCTDRALYNPGINIFGVFFHTHLAGIALSTRHFRNGKELPAIAVNKHYDFNYQEIVYLKNNVIVSPGDSLALTCTYQTKSRPNVTVGGQATTDEMCLNYLFYYPRAPLAACFSYTGYDTLTPYFGKLMKQGVMPPPRYNGSYGIARSLQKTTIGSQNLINELKSLQTYAIPKMYCSYANKSLVMERYNMPIPNFKSIANYTNDVTGTTPSTSEATAISPAHTVLALLSTTIILIFAN
ncbi:DBH-like monooxygenase protein 1-like protein [Trichoplax sp. H2]|nr:DBH-like monooxygenase protein 1-like protein [Trichoplax sp. H2]|eukprot:RDD36647.1 DBH-like monooxygenase protein 1-like protein [Trichoplax sp. H2]